MTFSWKLLIPGLMGLFLLSGCGSSTGTSSRDFAQAEGLMRSVIQEHVDQIPYQHGNELLANLVWLKQKGEISIPFLIKALDHPNPKMRSSSAWVLWQIGDKRAIPFLQKRLKDPNPIARLEIARSLVQLGDFSAIPLLIEGLKSDTKYVRFQCMEALRTVTGKNFGFDHLAEDPSVRMASIQKWEQWWNKQKRDPNFSGNYKKNLAKPGN